MSQSVAITGASQGIGAETAKAFAEAGYNVAISYLQNDDAAQEVVQSCEAHGVSAFAVKADCSTEDGIRMFANEIQAKYKTLNVLINNFANAEEPDFATMTRGELLETLDNILIPTIVTTQVFVPALMAQTAVVLNVASIYGLDQGGRTTMPIYSASKAAIINFTQTMAQRFAPSIRFNAVAPGFTYTPHWDRVPEAYVKESLGTNLQKEFVEAQEIAAALLFLARTPHINAETIVIDAGRSKV